jgi:hypothetical protein
MIITENIQISEGLTYHKNNKIPLDENIYRFGSVEYFKLYNEARKLYESGNLKPANESEEFFLKSDIGKIGIYEGKKVMLDFPMPVNEAEYQGKDVELNKPKRGGSKKFYVYVKDGDKVKKVSFGAKSGGGSLAVKLKDPEAKRAFKERHNCEQKNDKTKPGYWACRLPRYSKQLGLSGGGQWW